MQRTLMGLVMALSLIAGGAGVITAATAVATAPEARAFGLGDIGGAIKKGAKKAGGAVKKGAKAVGRGIEKGGKKLDSATRAVAKKVTAGVKKAGKTIGRGAKDIVRCWPTRCKITVPRPKYPDYPTRYGKASKNAKGQLRVGTSSPRRRVQGITRENLKPSRKAKGFATKDVKSGRAKSRLRVQTMGNRKRDAGQRGDRRKIRVDRRSEPKVQMRRTNGSRKDRRGRRG